MKEESSKCGPARFFRQSAKEPGKDQREEVTTGGKAASRKGRRRHGVLEAFLWAAAIMGWGAVGWVYHLHPHFP